MQDRAGRKQFADQRMVFLLSSGADRFCASGRFPAGAAEFVFDRHSQSIEGKRRALPVSRFGPSRGRSGLSEMLESDRIDERINTSGLLDLRLQNVNRGQLSASELV
jgi:hypothetical protein